jgi:hypothetical protein
MKSICKIIIAVLFLNTTAIITPQKLSAQQTTVSLQVFYDELSPYGQWVHHPNYGYVWMPSSVDADFVPYSSGGHWVFTAAGWTWVSDYSWGWAPFHYGRWANDPGYGWLWIPDTHWGPAWVAWRQSNDYFGWAPLGPGISIEASFGASYYNSIPPERWCFVRQADIVRPDVRNYYVDRTKNVTIIRNTTVIRNTYVNARNVTYTTGPSRERVQTVTRTTINPVTIHTEAKPGQATVVNNRINIYRPVVKPKTPQVPKPAPQKVVEWNNARPAAQPQQQPHPAPQQQPHPTPQQNPPVQNHPQPAPTHPQPQPEPKRPPGH